MYIRNIDQRIYESNKQKIDSRLHLKISDFTEDFKMRLENMKYESKNLLLKVVISWIIFMSIAYVIDIDWIKGNPLLSAPFFSFVSLVIFGAIYYLFLYLNQSLFSKGHFKMIYFTIPLPWLVFDLIIWHFIRFDNTNINITIIFLTVFISIFHSKFFYKSTPNYLLDIIVEDFSAVLSLISIITLLVSPSLFSSKNQWILIYSLSCILLTILLISVTFFANKKLRNNTEEARLIFREQLLIQSSQIDYDMLKKCYALGGEQYKDKMLSNEKFLKIILWNEENSFYTWKTYDNYLEYKNYRFKQFQKK
ncbi:TPA: hypothetical protein ACGO8C_000733 [Streptococcus suis]